MRKFYVQRRLRDRTRERVLLDLSNGTERVDHVQPELCGAEWLAERNSTLVS